MENQQSNSEEKIKMPHVPHDALINIAISGSFLKKMQTLLMGISEQMGQEKLQKAFEKFKDTSAVPDGVEEGTLFIITALVGETERQAIDQKKVQEIELTRDEIARMINI